MAPKTVKIMTATIALFFFLPAIAPAAWVDDWLQQKTRLHFIERVRGKRLCF